MQYPKQTGNVVRSILFLALLGSAAISAEAQQTFFIRDGAMGTTCSDWTTANACDFLPATLVRGATYYIAAGTYPPHIFGDAGTATITIRAATIADHGTNTGWQDSFEGVATFTALPVEGVPLEFTRGNYVLTGVRRTTKTSGHLIKVDCTPAAGNRTFCFAINLLSTSSNVTLEFLEIVGTGDANIDITPSEGVRCLDCTNLTMRFLYIHNPKDCWLLGNANNVLIERSVCEDNNNSAANHGQGFGDEGSDNVEIRYNDFVNIEGTAHVVVLNRGGGSQVAQGWKIHGNVFRCTSGVAAQCEVGNGIVACINGETCTDWEIYNNTIANITVGTTAMLCLNDCLGTNRVIKNNLWFNVRAPDNALAISGTNPQDFNTFLNTTVVTDPRRGPNDQWTPSGAPNPFVNDAGGDFHLNAATTPGTSLPAPFNTDPDGQTRGADGVWDRGAFEFTGAPPPRPRRAITDFF